MADQENRIDAASTKTIRKALSGQMAKSLLPVFKSEDDQLFASEEFAALVAADRVESFQCEYQGQADLPKKAGTMTVYLLRRNG